jgi:hypothetical protein
MQTNFKKGLSITDFMKDYGTEAQCEAAFAKARWPHGFHVSMLRMRRRFGQADVRA